MKYQSSKHALKGFTLLEMMVVLGIIAVLTAVVIPISRGYYASSRMRAQNSNAKVIYNSLQTVCQEFEFAERGEGGSMFYGNTAKEELGDKELEKHGFLKLFVVNGSIESLEVYRKEIAPDGLSTALKLSTSNMRVVSTPEGLVGGVPIKEAMDYYKYDENHNGATGDDDPMPSNFLQRVNRIFSNAETTSYVALIEDYTVRAVYAADTEDSYYIGAFPTRMDEDGNFSLTDIKVNNDEKPENILNYVNKAWKTSYKVTS